MNTARVLSKGREIYSEYAAMSYTVYAIIFMHNKKHSRAVAHAMDQ